MAERTNKYNFCCSRAFLVKYNLREISSIEVPIVEFPYLLNLNTEVVVTSAKCSLGTKKFLKKLADKANEK